MWLAGADRMRWRTYAIWTAAGDVAWATSVGLVAYGLGSAGAGAAWRRVRQGDPAWLFAAGLAEILSYAG